MAITSFVNYENEIEFEPTWPDSDKKVGIKFWLKSRQCDAAVAIANGYTKETIKDQIISRSGGKKDGGISDMADRAATRIVSQSPKIDAACVTKWDMGGQALFDEDGDKATPFNKKNVEKMFTDRRSAWIALQLSEAITGIENFTKA
tara:strand:- start:968 stop:1408 length:441 start_codon:yes stop_codon:yes gene_type:complete